MPVGDPRRQFKVGERPELSAQQLTRWQAAASDLEARSNMLSASPKSTGFTEGLIVVQNNSGADRKQFEILGIDDIIIAPDANLSEFTSNYAIKGAMPTVADHFGNFVVCANEIPDGGYGDAFVFGTCPVRISATDAGASTLDFLDVSDSDATKLIANPGGSAYVVFYSPTVDDNGDYWALVRLGNKQGAAGIAKITGDAGGGGWYTGTQCIPATGPLDPTTDVDDSVFQSAAGQDIYLANPGEIGGSTHWLSESGRKPDFFAILPIGTAADGKACYMIVDTAFLDCS